MRWAARYSGTHGFLTSDVFWIPTSPSVDSPLVSPVSTLIAPLTPKPGLTSRFHSTPSLNVVKKPEGQRLIQLLHKTFSSPLLTPGNPLSVSSPGLCDPQTGHQGLLRAHGYTFTFASAAPRPGMRSHQSKKHDTSAPAVQGSAPKPWTWGSCWKSLWYLAFPSLSKPILQVCCPFLTRSQVSLLLYHSFCTLFGVFILRDPKSEFQGCYIASI